MTWLGQIFVISYRGDRAKAEADLSKFRIHYDELILVDSFDAKSEIIAEKGILVYFDDQPEMLRNIPANHNVMLVRNGGNYDYEAKKWILSDKTGRML